MEQVRVEKDFSLDGEDYKIIMFPAEQGLKVLTKLVKIVGEPMMELAKMQQDKTAMYDHLASAIRSLALKLDDDNVVSLCKTLCSCVIKGGDGSMTLDRKFNLHFQGRLGHMFKLLVEVVNHNYADFLDVLALQSAGSAPTAKQ